MKFKTKFIIINNIIQLLSTSIRFIIGKHVFE